MKIITHDLYDITNRIKQVDRDYSICFDEKTNNFFVICKGQISFCCGKELNYTTIQKAYSSHIRNAREILSNMQEHNARLENHERLTAKEKSMFAFQNLLEYADGKGDVSFDGINKTRWL